jgi:hypothetical protein
MNKNGRGEFLEQDASIEQFANNQPTSSVARVIVLTRMASALSRSCLTFCLFLSRYRPGEHHLAVDHPEQPHRVLPNFAARRDCGTNDSPKSTHANRRILPLNFTLTVFTLACPEDPRNKETGWPLDDSSADSWNARPKLLV